MKRYGFHGISNLRNSFSNRSHLHSNSKLFSFKDQQQKSSISTSLKQQSTQSSINNNSHFFNNTNQFSNKNNFSSLLYFQSNSKIHYSLQNKRQFSTSKRGFDKTSTKFQYTDEDRERRRKLFSQSTADQEDPNAPEPVKIIPEQRTGTDKSFLLYQEAEKASNELNYEKAVDLWTQLIELNNNDTAAMLNRAAIFEELGYYKACESDAEMAYEIELDQKEPTPPVLGIAMRRIGEVSYIRGDYFNALACFKRSNEHYPRKEIAAFIKRTENLLGEVQNLKAENPNDHSLYYEKLLKNANASEKLEIGFSPEKGRFLIAKQKINEQEVLFVDQPLAFLETLVENENKNKQTQTQRKGQKKQTHCAHCLTILPELAFNDTFQRDLVSYEMFSEIFGEEGEKQVSEIYKEKLNLKNADSPQGLKCTHCAELYCSRKCRDDAEKEYHSLICSGRNPNVLTFVKKCEQENGEVPLFVMKLLAKILTERKEKENGMKNNDNENNSLEFALERFISIPNSHPELPQQEQSQWILMQKIFSENNNSLFPTMKEYFKWKSIVNLHSLEFGICQSVFGAKIEGKEIELKNGWIESFGVVGLLPLASLMNHSCVSNVAMKFPLLDSKKLTFVSTKPIEKGEELNWTYHFEEDVLERRKYLRSKYYFECNCEHCKEQLKTAKFVGSNSKRKETKKEKEKSKIEKKGNKERKREKSN